MFLSSVCGYMTLVAGFEIEALYAAHHGWLQRVLYRRLGCRETASDLVQDVFERLLGRPNAAPIQEPRAYLARIAHGLAVDHHRRRQIEQAWLDSLAALPEPFAASAQEECEVIDALARIDALLEGLRPRVRKIFLLSRMDGMSYPAIAKHLSVSLSTVEKDMAQALKHCYHVLMGL